MPPNVQAAKPPVVRAGDFDRTFPVPVYRGANPPGGYGAVPQNMIKVCNGAPPGTSPICLTNRALLKEPKPRQINRECITLRGCEQFGIYPSSVPFARSGGVLPFSQNPLKPTSFSLNRTPPNQNQRVESKGPHSHRIQPRPPDLDQGSGWASYRPSQATA